MPGKTSAENGKKGGRPKGGGLGPVTISKELAREEARTFIQAQLPRMMSAQIESACGVAHLMIRNEDGTWAKAPADMTADQMLLVLNGDANRYYISTKDPNTQAFNTLAAYALDKPKEQEQEVKFKGDTDLIAKLMAGRERAAKGRKS